jgi:hypothetical protein
LVAFALAVVLWSTALAQSGTNPWRDNLSRDQVVAALGQPKSTVQMGRREFLNYDNGVRIELQNGVVENISGPIPPALKFGAVTASAAPAPAAGKAAATAPTVTTTPPAPVAVPAVAPVTATPVATPAPMVVPAAAPVKPAASSAAGGPATTAKTEATSSDDAMVSEAANPTLPPEARKLVESAGLPSNVTIPGMGTLTTATPVVAPQNPWVGFGVGLVTCTVFLSVVLKVSFMRKDFPVIWRDVILVSFLTALFYQTMDSLLQGNAFFDIAHMLQADQVLAGMLLLVLIMKLTEVKQFHTAARITVAAIAVNTALSFVVSIFMPSF